MSLIDEIKKLKIYVNEKSSRSNKYTRDSIDIIHDMIINKNNNDNDLIKKNNKFKNNITILENGFVILKNENSDLKQNTNKLQIENNDLKEKIAILEKENTKILVQNRTNFKDNYDHNTLLKDENELLKKNIAIKETENTILKQPTQSIKRNDPLCFHQYNTNVQTQNIESKNDILKRINAKLLKNSDIVINNNLCLLEQNMNKFNIIINENKKLDTYPKIITTRDEVIKIYDDVYNLLFKHSKIFNYDANQLKLKINVQKRNNNILGQCVFKKCVCGKNQSLFDCNGPDIINIYLDDKSTCVRIAMVIAHELMHIYFHYMKHLNKDITNINGEEGLCELVAFYVGLFIKSDLKFDSKNIICNYETNQMLYKPSEKSIEKLTPNEHHIYTNYKLYFLQVYNDYNNYDGTLISYLNDTFLLKGAIKI